jgi:hypothetical protein
LQFETSIIKNNLKFVIELVQVFGDKKKFKRMLASSESFEKAKVLARE